MQIVLVALAVIGVFYILRPKVKVDVEPPALPTRDFFEEQPFLPPEVKLPLYSPGQTFHHKETGEKVEVVRSPEIVDGEYAIRWPSGDVGYIHQSSLKEFFE